VKKVGDLHQLCIGKFTRWCCPRNNPDLMQGQSDTSWMERSDKLTKPRATLHQLAFCWKMNCCSLVYFASVWSHVQRIVWTQIQRM
jgi:hypothetical protein